MRLNHLLQKNSCLTLVACSLLNTASNRHVDSEDKAKIGDNKLGSQQLTTRYYSRPDIRAPMLNVHVRSEEVSAGYIFIAPQSPFYQSGAHIYDSHGELIWGSGIQSIAYGFNVCDYDGVVGRHLCYFDGVQNFGHGRGYGVILDDTYKVVKIVHSTQGFDPHEFRVIENGRKALVTNCQTRPYDFEGLENPQDLQLIEDGLFQEIDVQTGSVLFEWSSLDHVKPIDATSRPVQFAAGETPSYDFFHINSVDKNRDGDYLVSARHTNSVYKISGGDGSIIWQMGSSDSTFALVGFQTLGQHDARWISENQTHTLLSLFDNGNDARTKQSPISLGMVIAIDHISSVATLIREYGTHENLSASSKGSMQILENKNVFIGWGSEAYVSEYLEDGTLMFHASFDGLGENYRALKQNWVGKPSDSPTIWTYAHTKQSQMVFYVSWNGATEVRAWKFYVGNFSESGRDFVLVGSKARTGFETNFTTPGYFQWAVAVAVAADGSNLGNSSVVSTWIPGVTLGARCDEWSCQELEAEFVVKYNDLPMPNAGHEQQDWDDLNDKVGQLQLAQMPISTISWMNQLLIVLGILGGGFSFSILLSVYMRGRIGISI